MSATQFRFDDRCRWLLVVAMAVTAAGCGGGSFLTQPAPVPVLVENPHFAPITDAEFVFDQIADALDDHFRIAREDRVREIGGVLTEGRLETYPEIGSTILEPWRGDAANTFEKLHGTLQSIRRRAVVRVMPAQGGFLIDLAVFKEIEDVPGADHIAAPSTRHDGSLVRTREFDPKLFGRPSAGWIPLGRDVALEQKILVGLRARLAR